MGISQVQPRSGVVNMMSLKSPSHVPMRLLSEEKPRLLNFIRKRIPGDVEPEDVYQEAVTRSLRRFRHNEDASDPVGYAYRIVINIINDHYRRTEDLESLDSEDSMNAVSHSPDLDRTLAAKHRLELFMACLSAMPEEARSLIILRKLHGLSIRQISSRVGLNDKTVEKRINRAMKSIEERMDSGVDIRPSSIRNKVKT